MRTYGFLNPLFDIYANNKIDEENNAVKYNGIKNVKKALGDIEYNGKHSTETDDTKQTANI